MKERGRKLVLAHPFFLSGSSQWAVTGSSPNRVFTWQLKNYPYFSDSTHTFTAQLKLHEASGVVDMLYLNAAVASPSGQLVRRSVKRGRRERESERERKRERAREREMSRWLWSCGYVISECRGGQ